MLQVIQRPLNQKVLDAGISGKILICDLNNSQGKAMQLFLQEYGFKNVVFQADITDLKKTVYYYRPDLVISGNHLWEDKTGIEFIMRLYFLKNAHIIIWSDNLNNRLLNLQLKYKNLFFVKKTNYENVLIETIRKIKSGND